MLGSGEEVRERGEEDGRPPDNSLSEIYIKAEVVHSGTEAEETEWDEENIPKLVLPNK